MSYAELTDALICCNFTGHGQRIEASGQVVCEMGWRVVMMESHYGANRTSAVEAEFDERFCMLFLITYVFLLRLSSEALPIVRGRSGFCGKWDEAQGSSVPS